MSDLIHRLRGKYPIGPIINGEPEFGWRDFGGPAPDGMTLPSRIMLEAAQRVEELESESQLLQKESDMYFEKLQKMRMALDLAKKMIISNGLDIPETMTVINEALDI